MTKKSGWNGLYVMVLTDERGMEIDSKVVLCYRSEVKTKLKEYKDNEKSHSAYAYHGTGGLSIESV